ncbi:galactokinase [Nocardia amikacinitolerans]|uniref:galactokinase n=1 Tax=Nocardia amikacinitolerans TaxID=756689 RepID=UPI000A056657|nr:galactokinase [Nocardia amikacinitolerans]MCP2321201.1 galactokinase [Nocardia amikacinitolerans]
MRTWVAPGRVNIIGEHTDYNDGFVLPIALPMVTRCAAATTADGFVRVESRQRPGESVQVGIDELVAARDRLSGWARYPLGVVAEFVRRGHAVPGLVLELDGAVPIGAGLSSSAALSCSVAVAVRDLCAPTVAVRELIDIARAAENDYAGAPTGVLDQSAAMLCTAGHALFLDVRRFSTTDAGYEQIPFDLAAFGLELLVVDTGQPHELVDGGYARRRAECASAAAELGVPALRDAELADLARITDPIGRRRARHVITENARVLAVADKLRRGADPREIGPDLSAGHASLRDDFEVSTDALDTAVTAALDVGAHGARMVGGGFGGSVIALVDRDRTEAVAAAVGDRFARSGFPAPRTFVVVPAAGARREL